MISLLQPADYCSPETFALERSILFSSLWSFVGFRSAVAKHEDFITVDVGGHSVLIQNFHGELRAFRNVCSHRFNRIHCEAAGHGPLRCQYHGWTYDEKGVPVGIPARPRFDFSPQDIEQLRLKSYEVASCGEFLFVRAEGRAADSLSAWLGDAQLALEQVSAALGELIDTNEITIAANWKVVVENVLESYHVGWVHSETFKKLGAAGMDFSFAGSHSAWNAPVDPAMTVQFEKVASHFESRKMKVPGYFHQFVFPLMTVATTFGTSFAIQRIEPVDVGLTRFTSYVFSAALPKADSKNLALQRAMNQSIVDFNRRVFEEDRIICESVQKGLPDAIGRGALSTEEERVRHFQSVYTSMLAMKSGGAR